MGAYGETIDTTSPTFARLTDDAAILQQAVELCLSTRRGTYWSAPEYGGSLRDKLLAGLTEAQTAAIPADITAALEEDERIARAVVSVSSVAARKVVLAITVYGKGSIGVPYRFVASITPDLVTVELQGIG